MNIKTITLSLAILDAFTLYSQKSPNVLVILADDFGYGSINRYGAPDSLVRTPNLNFLCDNGVKFTNAYTPASVSSPTRYGLLTGEYPWRSKMKHGVLGLNDPLLIPTEKVTIADLFKHEGYQTAVFGKWHLGFTNSRHDYTGTLSPGPLDLGFDYYFGIPHNNDDRAGVFIENNRVYGLRSRRLSPYSKSFYGNQYLGLDAPQRDNKSVMNIITERAINWIKAKDDNKPFFMYFASSAVHEPTTPSDLMTGTSEAGAYGDYIHDLDYNVGRLIQTLAYTGELDNTLILFTSDNGGEIPKRDDRAEKDAIKAGLNINGNLRGDKHTIWEGGTKVPFIVYWKGKINTGLECNEMINLVDVFATMNDFLGNRIKLEGNIAQDSFSFYKLLFDSSSKTIRKEMVTSDANGIMALRKGDWKYIDNYIPETLPKKKYDLLKSRLVPQLYNLKEDPLERKNVIDVNRKVADEMKKVLADIREGKK